MFCGGNTPFGEAFVCKVSGEVHFCKPDSTCPVVVGTQPGTLVCKISGKVVAEQIVPDVEGQIHTIHDGQVQEETEADGRPAEVEALQSAATIRAILNR